MAKWFGGATDRFLEGRRVGRRFSVIFRCASFDCQTKVVDEICFLEGRGPGRSVRGKGSEGRWKFQRKLDTGKRVLVRERSIPKRSLFPDDENRRHVFRFEETY